MSNEAEPKTTETSGERVVHVPPGEAVRTAGDTYTCLRRAGLNAPSSFSLITMLKIFGHVLDQTSCFVCQSSHWREGNSRAGDEGVARRAKRKASGITGTVKRLRAQRKGNAVETVSLMFDSLV